MQGMYKARRNALVATLKSAHPHLKSGAVVLIGGIEHGRRHFRQESSFYYYTGVTEPGCIALIDLSGETTIFTPAYAYDRLLWESQALAATAEAAKALDVDAIKLKGEPSVYGHPSYAMQQAELHAVIQAIEELLTKDSTIFMPLVGAQYAHSFAAVVVPVLTKLVPHLAGKLQDCSAAIAAQRRIKSRSEIEAIYKAVDATMVAHGAAANALGVGVQEIQIRAGIDYVFHDLGCEPAFPSIVASGPASAVLHHRPNKRALKQGDLVVVDIGAEFDYYCADITRTYPVSGQFTKRQKEIYNLVLDVHDLVAELAAPGMWLRNNERPEQSLHHRAVAYFEQKGFSKAFTHSIGHYLGLDVHDVGDYAAPLQEGDVITIEPGIYLKEEGFGIRVENDFWIIKDGAHNLSLDLPMAADEIEEMAQGGFDDEDDE
jgi:Xaa-Pro aminopeptidase